MNEPTATTVLLGRPVLLTFDEPRHEVTISLPGGSAFQILPIEVISEPYGRAPVSLLGVVLERLAGRNADEAHDAACREFRRKSHARLTGWHRASDGSTEAA